MVEIPVEVLYGVALNTSFTLYSLLTCASRRETAMGVYELYMDHTGMKTQLEKYPRST